MRDARARTAAGIAAALLLSASAGAMADTWVQYRADDYGRYSYDSASMKKASERVRVTLRMLLPDKPAGSAAQSMTFEVEIDCAGQSQAILSAQEYDASMKLLRSETATPEQIRHRPLYAGNGEELYRAVCPKGKPLRPAPPVGPPPIATPQN